MSFTLAIVGRPNVGKSTLFNRLVGKRLALVDDQPGVTRDLREGAARLADLTFTVIDTAGLEEATDESLQGRMRKLTERAVGMADICLFLIDGRAGVTATDEVFAEILRKKNAHVILGVNKAEGKAGEGGFLEAYALGLGEPVRLSAEHGEGMDDLYRVLQPLADVFDARAEALLDDLPLVDVDVSEDEEERGLFRADPGETPADCGDRAAECRQIDTDQQDPRRRAAADRAGSRDHPRCDLGADRLAGHADPDLRHGGNAQEGADHRQAGEDVGADGLRAVRFAEVVVVLLDVDIPFETQDLRIADFAETEGRAVVIAVNKWDLEDERQDKLRELNEMFERLLPQLRGAPLVTVSALTGRGFDRLHEAVLKAHAIWNRRIPTAKLNLWLRR